MGKKVVVGMSGGVDSSVAAYLLKEQGYDVIGVTMQIWQDESPDAVAENGGCCGLSAVEDARRVAERIGIQHYVMNFREEFQKHVINYFTAEYLAGRTPNPCIACNRYIKWEALLNRSYAIGAEFMATGHYARIEKLPNGRLAIRNSVTARKDQTYALYNLTQEQLAHTLLPVGDYDKEQIRQIAGQIGLTVAAKPDSQDICFVPDGDYSAFLGREIPDRIPPEGNFVTKDGEVLGRHKGITHYTIGQRKGLGIALGHPVFVSDIRPETNEVVIGENEDIFSDTLTCNQLNFMGMADVTEPVACMAKVRYAHRGEKCTLSRTGEDSLLVKFEKPVRAITPGQAVVFYDGEYVLGGGTIL